MTAAVQLDLLDLLTEQTLPSRLLFVATLNASVIGGFPVPAIVAGYRPGQEFPIRPATEGGTASGQLTWRIHNGNIEIRENTVEKHGREYVITDRIKTEEVHDLTALYEWADHLPADTRTQARAIADRATNGILHPMDWRCLNDIAARALGKP